MNWNEALQAEASKPYFSKLNEFMKSEYNSKQIFPPADKVLAAIELTPLENVKCVIIGQDPYHGEGQAMGLSFSVPNGIKCPPSLVNIYKELENEYGYPIPKTGNLTPWTKEGVLLLNSVLTVIAHTPNSHKNCGWENYTDAIIRAVETQNRPIVYMLWGANAKQKKELITNKNHLVLESAHPSPYSCNGFFGNNHFKKCNEFLSKNGASEINWQIT